MTASQQPPAHPATRERVHVAVAAIVDAKSRVLITRRHTAAHQGGLWEFPGGKLEAQETIEQALARELNEELGIEPLRMRPLIRIAHDYPDKCVLLDTWRVDDYAGVATAREGQPLQWVAAAELDRLQFPAANHGIVKALQLTSRLLITPEPGVESHRDFLRTLHTSVARHQLSLVQLRAKHLSARQYLQLAQPALDSCNALGAALMLNGEPHLLQQVDARGIHIPASDLMRYRERPISIDKYLSVAVHDEREMELALGLEPDFVLLSPVKRTTTHPQAVPLGWQRFAQIAELSDVPVFALGGLHEHDLTQAQRNGAQGIAAISAFWD